MQKGGTQKNHTAIPSLKLKHSKASENKVVQRRDMIKKTLDKEETRKECANQSTQINQPTQKT
jgi:hypothetical protein